MKLRIMLVALLTLTGAFGLEAPLRAQEATSGSCTGPHGNRFNLEPRLDAVNQTALSVAFLLNGASPGTDLVVGTALDARGLQGTLESEDAFYIQRSNSDCAADSEGGLPAVQTLNDVFLPFGSPVIAADPVRNTFFAADLRFGETTEMLGFGVLRATAANLLSTTACPSGTQTNSATCWPTGNVVSQESINFNLMNPLFSGRSAHNRDGRRGRVCRRVGGEPHPVSSDAERYAVGLHEHPVELQQPGDHQRERFLCG